MTDAERTVFISYRTQTSRFLAAYLDRDLRAHGFDVFRDVSDIPAGDWERVLFAQIEARMHFVVLLGPDTLESEWVRREIIHAMRQGRNVVPLLVDCDYTAPGVQRYLSGDLANLPRYQSLTIHYDYLDEGLARLRTRYLLPPAHAVSITPAPASDDVLVLREQAQTEAQPAPTEQQISAEDYFNRANARYHQGDLAGAVADYTETIRLAPTFPAAYNNRGLARAHQNDLTGALADFSRAIELDDTLLHENYNNRGLVRKLLGDYAGALADYAEAIRLNPDYFEPYYNRGIVHYEQQRLPDALADFDTALRLKPERPDARYNRANVHKVLGNTADALADYTEAIRLMPGYTDAHYNRALAHLDNGDLAGALADFQTYLDVGGAQNAVERRQVERRINDLRRRMGR